MKEIILSRGMFAKVSDEDFEWLSRYRWFAHKDKNNWYAHTTLLREDGTRFITSMHRIVLGITGDRKMRGDHINHNGLDNTRENLRIVTSADNSRNRRKSKRSNSTSQYKGVHARLDSVTKKYRAAIRTRAGGLINLGSFPYTPEGEIEAAKAYDKAAVRIFAEYACLNFPDDYKKEGDKPFKVLPRFCNPCNALKTATLLYN